MASEAKTNYGNVDDFRSKVFEYGSMFDKDGIYVAIVLKDKLIDAYGNKYYTFTGMNDIDIIVPKEVFTEAHNNEHASKHGYIWGPFYRVLNDGTLDKYDPTASQDPKITYIASVSAYHTLTFIKARAEK